jgi:phosphate transport system permease protein
MANHQQETGNPFAAPPRQEDRRASRERVLTLAFRLLTYAILACALSIFLGVVMRGAPVIFQAEAPFINTDFFTRLPETLVVYEDDQGEVRKLSATRFEEMRSANPGRRFSIVDSYSYSGGGILGPLVGTALLIAICMAISLSVGIASAIYLSEYSSKGRFMSTVRLAILNLAGVPSIVFGLFGLGLFCLAAPNLVPVDQIADRSLFSVPIPLTGAAVSFEGWGACMLAGGCTLAIMILPVIITAAEESLRAVPQGFREASLALGATRWQTIRKSVLPYAFPGMLTASILGITRVAGETAPIMFTAAVAHKDKLPWIGQDPDSSWAGRFLDFFFQSVQALPYHIYTVAAKIPQSEYNKDMQYGSVFVFMALVFFFAALSIWLRARIRRRLHW